jgi:hypothetical protein
VGKLWDFIRSQPGLWTDGHNIFLYHDRTAGRADTVRKPPAQCLHGFAEVFAEIEWILNPALPPSEAEILIPVRTSRAFIEKLPPAFQTQTGVMFLAALAALLGMSLILFAFLYLRVI